MQTLELLLTNVVSLEPQCELIVLLVIFRYGYHGVIDIKILIYATTIGHVPIGVIHIVYESNRICTDYTERLLDKFLYK